MAPCRRLRYLARRASRLTVAVNVRAELVKEVEYSDVALVLRWDGKLMTNVDGEAGRVYRLALVVSSPQLSLEKLPAVPLRAGSGTAMANKAADVVVEWELEDRVVPLAFGTTASNNGFHSGCCN